MCNAYRPPSEAEVHKHFGVNTNDLHWTGEVHPRKQGPFIRRGLDDASYSRELCVGQWGLIPWFAKERTLKYSTNNARSEELADKASYKQPWAKAQRCIIPTSTFDEPNWETGKNVWWRFARTDGAPWALAGLWNRWVDSKTGEIVESYTMLTINADSHPLMSRMHKPDPQQPADAQDKRSVIPIEQEDIEEWLAGTPAQAQSLLRLAPVNVFEAFTN